MRSAIKVRTGQGGREGLGRALRLKVDQLAHGQAGVQVAARSLRPALLVERTRWRGWHGQVCPQQQHSAYNVVRDEQAEVTGWVRDPGDLKSSSGTCCCGHTCPRKAELRRGWPGGDPAGFRSGELGGRGVW